MMVQALLDFVNLSAYIPLIALLSHPQAANSIEWLPEKLRGVSFSTTVGVLTAGLLVFSVAKHLITEWITHVKSSFAYKVSELISTRIWNEQMHLTHEDFSLLDQSKEMDRVLNQPLAFANNIVIGLTTILSEGLVAILLLVGMGYFNLKLLGGILIVSVPVIIVYGFRRKHLKKISAELGEMYPSSAKATVQALSGRLEIKASQSERYFFELFLQRSGALRAAFSKVHDLQVSATRFTDLITSVIICFLILSLLVVRSSSDLVPLYLLIYVGAGFRLLPSINRILNAAIQIESHRYLFESLKPRNGSAHFSPINHTTAHFEKEILLEAVSYVYPNRKAVFNSASLKINKGEKVALTGKSGEGKTTLLHLLIGILKPTTGKISIDGIVISDHVWNGFQELFSYVPQNPYILDASILENVAFGIRPEQIDHERAMATLHQVKLGDFVAQLPNRERTQVGEGGILLSGGQRQRLALARAIYSKRPILVLDEVTNHLDRDTEQEVVNALEEIAAHDRTMIMVTHHAQLMKSFDRVLEIKSGQLTEVTSRFLTPSNIPGT